MPCYAALDVAQATTAICVVDEEGRILAEKTVTTCPDAITDFLANRAPGLVRVGMETGPLAIWLWNELAEGRRPGRDVPTSIIFHRPRPKQTG